jgi:polysaccharide biosynthesis protein PelA
MQLAAYELAILQAEAYTPHEIAHLAAQHTQTLAYLSVGEVPAAEADASWLMLDPETGTSLRNEQWDTLLVDCRSPAWQRHILSAAIPQLLARGFAGLFLDTIDVHDRVPVTRPGVVALLQQIRKAHPTIPILVNRGFSLLETVVDVADGVLFEAFTTRYDGRRYAAWEGADLAWTGAMAVRLRESAPELPLFALDYADPEDHGLRKRAKRRAEAYGMGSFVAPYGLDWLPETPPDAEPSQPHPRARG